MKFFINNSNALKATIAILIFWPFLNTEGQISGTKTVGNGGQYTTLTAAMAALNSAGISGAVTLEITTNYNLGNESFPVVLGNINGASALNTITIRPQSGVNGLMLISSNAVPVFSFIGGKYFVIDGRPGGTGQLDSNSMALSSTSSFAPTLLFTNESSLNIIKYCDVQGNNGTAMTSTTTAGVICFGTTNGSNGNDYNLISNCNIHGNSGGTPSIGVFGYGSITSQQTFNDSNTIENCNISDYNAGANSCGIYLSAGCNAWNITNNHFFQSVATSYITAHIHRVIYLTTGSGYILTGNYIGGNNPSGSGTYTISGTTTASTNTFIGIDHSTSTQTQLNTISNNTITNIDYSSAASGSAVMVFLQIYGGNVLCQNNIIGSNTLNGAIKFTTFNPTAASVGGIIGLRVGTNSNTVTLIGNVISGIDLYAAQPGFAPEFHGINLTTALSTSVFTVTGNTVGSKTLSNSINIVSTSISSTAPARLDGFIINNTSAISSMTVSGNTVANLNTNYSATGTQAASTRAIWINPQAVGNFIISNNEVFNISSASQTSGITVNAALIGISASTTTGTISIIGNKVYNLKLKGSSVTSAVLCTGIYFSGSSSTSSTIEKNLIRHLSVAAYNPFINLTGIELNAGQVNVSNNMIGLGFDTAGKNIQVPLVMKGLYKNGTISSIYFNTVYLGGSVDTSSTPGNSYALYRAGTAFDDIQNNIFVNNRSNLSIGGTHYQAFMSTTSSTTLGYNIYMGNGTGSKFGYNGVSDVNAYTINWMTGDNSSFTSGANLIAANGGNQTFNLHLSSAVNKGNAISGYSRDFDNDLRNTPPDIGADEIPFDIGVVGIDSPSTTSLCSSTKNIWVRIKNFGTIPVTTAKVNLNHNGVLIKTFIWTGTLNGGTTSAAFNIGTLNLNNGGSNLVTVNTTSPNNLLDNLASNDTFGVIYNVTLSLTPTVSVKASDTVVCTNSPVTFSLQYNGTGLVPTFEWKRNGSVVGTNDSIYTASALNNLDTISIKISTTYACAIQPSAVSQVIIKVSNALVPKVTLTPNILLSCVADSVIYTASVQYGGATPTYKWQRNGVTLSGTQNQIKVFMSATDSLRCIMNTSLSCATKQADTSAWIKFNIPPVLNVSASITNRASSICAGLNDTFDFTANTGYSSLIWYVNGVQKFSDNIQYVTNQINNGDSIYAVVTSNAPCPSPKIATTNKIRVNVIALTTPTALITLNKSTLCVGDTLKVKGTFSDGGLSPIKEWYKNGVLYVSGVDSFTTKVFNNNDTFLIRYTSNAACLTQKTVFSPTESIKVFSNVSPTVSIGASATNICSGAAVTFTAIPVNGGSAPHFTWKKNGIILGSDSTSFTTTSINHNDSIHVVMLNNVACASRSIDSSAKIKMSVTPTFTPSVTIQTNTPNFCSGKTVAFSSIPLNGGSNPHYSWYRNGLKVGTDSIGLILNNPSDHDTLQLKLNSSYSCVSANDVPSNKVVLFRIFSPIPTINITSSVNNVCKGTSVTFTSSKTDPGTTPLFEWFINNVAKGGNTANFTTDSLNDNDSVLVRMTSSAQCANPAIVSSNKIGMKIIPLITPAVSIQSNPTSICHGGVVTFTASDVNGGSKPVHRWLLNGFTAGSDSTNFTTNMLSSYVVKCVLTTNATCPSKLRDTAISTVVVHPTPPTPVITKSYDTLFSTSATTYQWVLNNIDLSGSINRSHIATQNGSYKVKIEINGCKNISDPLLINNVGIQNLIKDHANVHIWPNPGMNDLFLSAEYDETAEGSIEVTDVLGRTLKKIALQNATHYQIAIDMSQLNEGSYMIHIKHGSQSEIRKWQRINH